MLELLHFRTPLELELGAVKLSAAFFNDESSITIGGGVRKCNSAAMLELAIIHLSVLIGVLYV